MKFNKKTSKHFFLFLVLGIIIGSLCWELLERLIALSGYDLNLTAGPVGIDAGVLEVRLMVNPGSLLGGACGYLLFRRV